jgi:flotillin
MQALSGYLGNLVIPVVVVLLAVAFLLTVKFIASRYKKIPPTKAGIFYGRKYKVKIAGGVEERGFMVVLGGGRVLMPLVESYKEMSTAAFQVTIDETNIPNQDNVKFMIKGVATCKVSTVTENIYRAAGAFLDKTEEEIEEFIRNILKGHLRSIVGKLDINSLLRERDEFNKKVVAESSPELAALGMEMVNLVIQDITDAEGYIDALGKKAVAETKAAAQIRVAEAQRDQDIAVSNAEQEAATVKAENAARIAEANRDRDVRTADARTIAETQRAASEKAFAIATAGRDKVLRVAEADRDAAEKEAQAAVQTKEAVRRQRELEATVIRQAEADQQTTIIAAEAARKKKTIEAEAEAAALTATAQAKKNATVLEGEGEAAKQKAILLAVAEGNAAAKKQALLGEAEGTQKLAEALREMSDAARLIIILDKLPALLDKGGDAAAKVMQAIFSSVAAPLGQIDKIEIIDVGGSGRGIDQMASVVPNTVFKFLANAKAQGIDFTALLGKLGIDASKSGLMSGLSSADTNGTPAVTEK